MSPLNTPLLYEGKVIGGKWKPVSNLISGYYLAPVSAPGYCQKDCKFRVNIAST